MCRPVVRLWHSWVCSPTSPGPLPAPSSARTGKPASRSTRLPSLLTACQQGGTAQFALATDRRPGDRAHAGVRDPKPRRHEHHRPAPQIHHHEPPPRDRACSAAGGNRTTARFVGLSQARLTTGVAESASRMKVLKHGARARIPPCGTWNTISTPNFAPSLQSDIVSLSLLFSVKTIEERSHAKNHWWSNGDHRRVVISI